ncbi:hypothetical protein FKC55_00730 [Listeria monocytogenes]|uniref:hypothetical protein n=1 Tax=Listeria booriae TaxID=1552123 RepID=UPI0012CE15F5|nr:hypothetical protein [Listeria booriae]ECL0264395.1 hypothetical protein [Listeria monocytogenes]EKR8711461.1 hypothetical protein [Listeria monocytogenes]ELQ0050881.1 hypothetical protein [Listeria monocytogenes]ELQ0053992.1 hypothetical protein [Listeria monocytogenes]MBC2315213.1 hypothetical protein [Listeria booriae]
MNAQTLTEDFDQFCLMRVQAIFEADTNHENFQKRSNHFYQVRDQLELLRQPEILTYLDALEKYQVEALLYIYSVAFKEGLQFLQNK